MTIQTTLAPLHSNPPPPQLNDEEAEFISLWRRLPPRQKELGRRLITTAQDYPVDLLRRLVAETVGMGHDEVYDLIEKHLATPPNPSNLPNLETTLQRDTLSNPSNLPNLGEQPERIRRIRQIRRPLGAEKQPDAVQPC